MKYQFFNFILDSKRQTLFHLDNEDEIEIDITKTNYQMLLFFIQHQSEVVTKEQIIEAVWPGKMVTENSIDQSISKIRKSLSEHDERIIIKTVYGKGLEFTPEVVANNAEATNTEKPSKESFKRLIWLPFIGLVALLLWEFLPQLINQPKADNQIPVMWLSDTDDNDWLDQGSHQLLNQLFSNTSHNHLLNNEDKPSQLSNQQYIDNYWRINPDLEVIKTNLIQQQDIYILEVQIVTQGNNKSERFSGTDLLYVLADSKRWLSENSSLNTEQPKSHDLLPNDSHVLELYMRSLHALKYGELDQALNYAQLTVDQEPDFDLGWLQLAEIQYKQGLNEESLSILDKLPSSPHYEQIEITAQSLKGDILDTAGQYQAAIETYQQLLDKYPEEAQGKLLPVKFNLSYSLTSELRYEEALTALDEIITALDDQFDIDLMAHAWHKKGSVLQQMGHTKEAKQAAELAYQHFNDLSDMMSSAKVSILLARIANHEADYQQAADYLHQAIGIARQAEFPLGVGAALNELTYILMVNGELTQAWTQMLEMKQIAQDIDYFAMLMAAKEFEIEISRTRQQWAQAEASLAEFFRMATDNEFTRGLFKHQIYELDLALDQNQIKRAEPLIMAIQNHIDSSGEVRLQPRLNVQQAKAYFLQNQTEQAVELLNQTKAKALLTDDMETIHEINNELLRYYVDTEDYQSAQTIMIAVDQTESKPLPYPYLLLKSKALSGLGKNAQALNWAKQSKKQANEFWRPADEKYLTNLRPDPS